VYCSPNNNYIKAKPLIFKLMLLDTVSIFQH